jgi:hypothetical protein
MYNCSVKHSEHRAAAIYDFYVERAENRAEKNACGTPFESIKFLPESVCREACSALIPWKQAISS